MRGSATLPTTTTTSVSATPTTQFPTSLTGFVPPIAPTEYCDSLGNARRVFGQTGVGGALATRPPPDFFVADLVTHEIVELSLGPQSRLVRTGVVLPDGTLLLATRGEPTPDGIIPGELFLLDANGNHDVIAINDLPREYEDDRDVLITGIDCNDRHLTVEAVFYLTDFDAVIRSYRVPLADPTAATLR